MNSCWTRKASRPESPKNVLGWPFCGSTFFTSMFASRHRYYFSRLWQRNSFSRRTKTRQNYLSREDEDKFRLETLCVPLAGGLFRSGEMFIFYDKCKLRKCFEDLNDLLSDSDKSFHSWQVCWVRVNKAPLKLHRFFLLINESAEQQVGGRLVVVSMMKFAQLGWIT